MTMNTVSVCHMDARRGRGVVAEVEFSPGDVILRVPYDIAVLYSPFVLSTCHRCFEPIRQAATGASTADKPYKCIACEQFVLCAMCVRELRLEVSRKEEHFATSGALSSGNSQLQQHSILRIHSTSCSWFCTLPASVRAGDTDYLRFALQYGARMLHGDTRLVLAIESLCTNADQQSPEVRKFCESYAHLIVSTFASKGYPVDADHLCHVLMRTKCNSIGYPFNNSETLGWALQKEMCMLNHSCSPNAAIVRASFACSASMLSSSSFPQTSSSLSCSYFPHVGCGERAARDPDLACAMELVARRSIAVGEEVTIAYIDVDHFASDVKARARALLESYRFLCRCSMCEQQRRND